MKVKYVILTLLILTASPVLSQSTATQLSLDVKTIMQDPAWIGSQPSRPYWSEDGKTIYFYWNPENADADSLYRIGIGGGAPVKVSLREQKKLPASSGVYDRSYTRKLFSKNGDIFIYDLKKKKLRRLMKTTDAETSPRFSHDEKSVIYRVGGKLYRYSLRDGTITQIVEIKSGKKKEEPKEPKDPAEKFVRSEQLSLIEVLAERTAKKERAKKAREAGSDKVPVYYVGPFSIMQMQLSPDGRYVTLNLREKKGGGKRTIVPNYVTESGYTEDIPSRSKVGGKQAKTKLMIVDLQADTLFTVKPDDLPEIFTIRPYTTVSDTGKTAGKKKGKKKARQVRFHGPFWNHAGDRAFVVAASMDNKDRWLAFLDPATGALTSFEHQYDEAWIGGPNIGGRWWPGSVGWLPDDSGVWFCSEASGYSHLYVYDLKKQKTRALTSGEFEIYSPVISRDKKYWYFSANREHPGERHYYRLPLKGGAMQKLTSLPGRNDARLSPTGKHLLIRNSYSNRPWELYVQKNEPGARARRLTHSTTEKWRSYNWRVPEIVRIPAEDGAKPYARLYKPQKPNGAAVIFVHGAGYLQNAHKWWSSYFREYMFHNLLADLGYTVLDIDYRGSAGYGRDWRTAIYRFMGGKDLDDQIDGARWLVQEHGIDPQRIGIYGGSYGGFITFMALFTKPGVFASGAALRPVSDWAHYNHGYTSNILNIPQADTLAYRRSSPIYHAEGLQGHLLICVGMIDTNVHFQDVVRVVQRLIELEKENWEVAIYPLEGHGFREPSSWTDEYRRILKLFERTLRK